MSILLLIINLKKLLQIITEGLEEISLPPITTPTDALEFQKAIDESSQGRDVLTVKVRFVYF